MRLGFYSDPINNVKPYVLFTPHHIAVPLTSKVKKKLEQRQGMRVIPKVIRPTEWYAGIEGNAECGHQGIQMPLLLSVWIIVYFQELTHAASSVARLLST